MNFDVFECPFEFEIDCRRFFIHYHGLWSFCLIRGDGNERNLGMRRAENFQEIGE